jgi:hypothetical protein
MKYGGTKFEILQDYTTKSFLNEHKYGIQFTNYAYHWATNTRYFSLLDPTQGIARLAAQEYILNNKNYSLPKVGDFYGRSIELLTALPDREKPRIFYVDAINKKFKIYFSSTNIGYTNYEVLSKYGQSLAYNMGYGSRIPTMEEINIINREFYLKGLLSTGNGIIYSSNQDINDPEKIQMFNFGRQEIEVEYKNKTGSLRVAGQLLVKEISY